MFRRSSSVLSTEPASDFIRLEESIYFSFILCMPLFEWELSCTWLFITVWHYCLSLTVSQGGKPKPVLSHKAYACANVAITYFAYRYRYGRIRPKTTLRLGPVQFITHTYETKPEFENVNRSGCIWTQISLKNTTRMIENWRIKCLGYQGWLEMFWSFECLKF